MANVLEDRGVFWWFQEVHGHTASLETAVPGTLTICEESTLTMAAATRIPYLDQNIVPLHLSEAGK